MKINIVIPTLNESTTIESVVKECKKYGKVIVVDGYSTDGTDKIAKKAGAKLIYEQKKGYGRAYLTGFQNLDKDAEFIVLIDGDGTYAAEKIPIMLKELKKGFDLVLAKRFSEEMERESMNFFNRTGNYWFSWVFRKLYKLKIADSQTGFRAIKKDALNRMILSQEGMPIAMEMLIEASKNNLKVKEIEGGYKKRKGKAKLNPFSDGIRILNTTFWLLRDYSPLKFFGFIGSFFCFIGFIIGLKTAIVWYQTRSQTFHVGLAILSTLCILIGIQIIIGGLISDTVKRTVERYRRI